jgi:hypothetical protein
MWLAASHVSLQGQAKRRMVALLALAQSGPEQQ